MQLEHPTWEIMDSTKISAYQRCPRRYMFEYILGWRTDGVNNHLIFGEAWHRAMECLLKQGYSSDALVMAMDIFNDYYRTHLAEETDELYAPKTPQNAMAALAAYVRQWPNDHTIYEVIETEHAGTALLYDDIEVHFRLDAILRDKSTGKYFALEHKTGSSAWNWADQWTLSIQMSMYLHALCCRYGHENVDNITVNGSIFKKSKKGWDALLSGDIPSTSPLDFVRVPIQRPVASLEAWAASVISTVLNIRADIADIKDQPQAEILTAFIQHPHECTSFGRLCPYHDFCLAWPNPIRRALDLERPPTGFKTEYWDPSNRQEKTDA